VMRRPVTYTEGNAGIWSIDCAACPLKPHFEAIGRPVKPCAGGIATNMQGPVVLQNCPHSAGTETVQNEPDNALSIECRYGAQP
jgi:hypothetical protein